MAALNEAYDVLKDTVKRKEYDSERRGKNQAEESYFTGEVGGPPSGSDPLQEDWDLADVFFNGELVQIEKQLENISWQLAYTFKAFLLQEKAFEMRFQIAEQLEQDFFEFHYGSSPRILSFAKELIAKSRHKEAAELAHVMQVLGHDAEAARVLSRFDHVEVSPSEADPQAARDLMSLHSIDYFDGSYRYKNLPFVKLDHAVRYAEKQERMKKA